MLRYSAPKHWSLVGPQDDRPMCQALQPYHQPSSMLSTSKYAMSHHECQVPNHLLYPFIVSFMIFHASSCFIICKYHEISSFNLIQSASFQDFPGSPTGPTRGSQKFPGPCRPLAVPLPPPAPHPRAHPGPMPKRWQMGPRRAPRAAR